MLTQRAAVSARVTVAFIAALLLQAGLARAGSITVGTAEPATGDCVPFSCYGDAQQLYNSSSFTAPVYIESVTFFHTQYLFGSSLPALTFDLSLSTSTKTMTGLSSTLSANVGADSQLFFSGTTPAGPSATIPYEFTITGATPFYYNPSAGNLLLTFHKPSPGQTANYYWDFDANNGGLISRVYDGPPYDGSGHTGSNYGIVTRFNVAAVPDPAWSILLLAIGLVGICVFATTVSPRRVRD